MTLEAAIEQIAIVTFEPGDVLVIRTPSKLSSARVEHLERKLRRVTPVNVDVMVLDSGASLEVLRAGEG